jgi:hypothetical protein
MAVNGIGQMRTFEDDEPYFFLIPDPLYIPQYPPKDELVLNDSQESFLRLA